ncbi:TetR family transcriptional regulator [uncultured Gordonia sp.]|uniref:TetR family transcriptional regulator n=1 Tax=uncultured Gordonia sp. TaxID=198437 RepID=UPI002586BD9B|nr:TetR family transcriptional regulator [uncultured Gordonia sp.]
MVDSDSTRDRIIAAATVEFAEHGISGARIERIAKSARTSKERVYAYFRGKDDLYRYVAARELTAMAEAVPLNPADLPDYAVRVHDHLVKYPARLRLMKWGQLEQRSDEQAAGDDPFRLLIDGKVDQLRRAQTDGVIDGHWDPRDILVFVSQLATSWAEQADLIPIGRERDVFLDERRRAINDAVGRIFPPTSPGVR